MTPAEHARSQGWMVGDLFLTQHGNAELTALGCRIVLLRWLAPDIESCYGDREHHEWCNWRRIGRVLRPSNEGR